MARPSVDIITTVKNPTRASLKKTIRGLERQNKSVISRWIVVDASDVPKENLFSSDELKTQYIHAPGTNIYSGMNIGIHSSTATHSLIVNAGDELIPGCLEFAFGKIPDNDSAIWIGRILREGRTASPINEINHSIFLHHLEISHNAAFIPRTVYEKISFYATDFDIVSDAIWFRKAFDAKVQINRLNFPIVIFEQGGMSDGKDEEQRNRIVNEHVRAMSSVFKKTSIGLLRELYLDRFNPGHSDGLMNELATNSPLESNLERALRDYIRHKYHQMDFGNLKKKHFLERCVISSYLWPHALPLDIVHKDGRGAVEAKNCFFHVIKVFSRTTETFVLEAVKSTSRIGYTPVVVSDFSVNIERLQGVLHFSSEDYGFHFSDLTPSQVQLVTPNAFVKGSQFHFINNLTLFEGWAKIYCQSVPTLVSTHGVDVLDAQNDRRLESFFKECLDSNKVIATTPSNYLKTKLLEMGVTDEKIATVGNGASNWNCAIKKSGEIGPAQILNIARPVAFKGHEILFRSIRLLLDQGVDLRLQCVLGTNDEIDIKKIRALAKENNILGHIDVFGELDFKDARLSMVVDLLVSSALDEQVVGRSETFGMAAVEALNRGVPVVATDAGAQREILSPMNFPNNHNLATFCEAGSAESLASAIYEALENAKALEGQGERSDDAFSSSKYEALIETALKSAEVTVFGSYTTSVKGGAGSSAARLHESLNREDFPSFMSKLITAHGGSYGSDHSYEISPLSSNDISKSPGYSIISDSYDTDAVEYLDSLDGVGHIDVHLIQWTKGLLSSKFIEQLTWENQRVIIVARDYQHVTGGCHYLHGCDRFKLDCANCPQVSSLVNKEKISDNYARKITNFNHENISWIALSSHSAELIKHSRLVSPQRLGIIPNIVRKIDTSRTISNRVERKTIAVIQSFDSMAKAVDLSKGLIQEFRRLHHETGERFLLLFSPSSKLQKEDEFSGVQVEIIDSDQVLESLESSNLLIQLSREETYSNTVMEALSLKTPVVSSRVGVSADLEKESMNLECVESVEDLADIVRVSSRKASIGWIDDDKNNKIFEYRSPEHVVGLLNDFIGTMRPVISEIQKAPPSIQKDWFVRRVRMISYSSVSSSQTGRDSTLIRLVRKLLSIRVWHLRVAAHMLIKDRDGLRQAVRGFVRS